MLRISIDGQLAEMQLKRTIKPNLWNQKKERCTGKDAALKYMKDMTLKKYHTKDIPLKEVNHAFIQDYIHFLKTEKGLSENTLIRYMKVIKKITNMALANDWMTKNPFVNIRFHEQKVHKEFLTKEELEILRTKEFDIPRLELVHDVFLFQCFTGLAFVDVSELKEEHIVPDSEGNYGLQSKAENKNHV